MATLVELTPLDRYLAEQQSLTAVERFARHHDAELLEAGARYYRDAIPLERPQQGQQYGFEVDLDACTGCKACVSACQHLNGLDEGESWRSVGLLYGGDAAQPLLQTVTTACHHCIDPACMGGCPVNAYEKDDVTGIVRHLDDQCIGCGYCTLTCPYEVPQLNRKRGIVRKCDMCSDRLEAGEAPACVQACPTEAIRITLVDTEAMARAASAGSFLVSRGLGAPLPTAPPPAITIPTTRYVTKRELGPDVLPADHFWIRPAPAHPPLAVMLVLTQLAVGAFVADLALRAVAGEPVVDVLRPYNAVGALALGVLALGVSVLHLGRPLYAFRAVIGFRDSWLSREIIAFAGFALFSAAYAWESRSPGATMPLGILAGLTGIAALTCSVMVYAATGRVWWRARATGVRFAMTAVVCGLATVLVSTLGWSLASGGETAERALLELGRPLAALLTLACAAKLVWEAGIFRHLRSTETTDLGRTALLLARDLRTVTGWRFGTGVVGGIGLPLLILAVAAQPEPSTMFCAVAAGLGLLVVVAGELLERSLFFTACAAPRMPGGL